METIILKESEDTGEIIKAHFTPHAQIKYTRVKVLQEFSKDVEILYEGMGNFKDTKEQLLKYDSDIKKILQFSGYKNFYVFITKSKDRITQEYVNTLNSETKTINSITMTKKNKSVGVNKSWSEKELSELYNGSSREVADRLGKTFAAVANKRFKIRTSQPKLYKKLQAELKSKIKEEITGVKESKKPISQKFESTIDSTVIYKPDSEERRKHSYTIEEDLILLYFTKDKQIASKLLNRTISGIKGREYNLSKLPERMAYLKVKLNDKEYVKQVISAKDQTLSEQLFGSHTNFTETVHIDEERSSSKVKEKKEEILPAVIIEEIPSNFVFTVDRFKLVFKKQPGAIAIKGDTVYID